MKRTLRLILFLFFALALPPAGHAASSRLALIIGNNTGSNGLATLRYAEQDAKTLYSALVQLGDFPENQVKLLLGKNPQTFKEAVRSLQTQALHLLKNPSDHLLLLVYFSGHSEGGSLEFGPHSIEYDAFLREIRKIPSSLRIIILDACHSGDAIRSKGGTTVPPLSIHVEESEMPAGEIIMTSSTGIEESLESDDLQGSFFSHYLISGLRGAADFNLDGKVSLTEVYSYASEKTEKRTAGVKRSQHPTFEFKMTGSGEVYLTNIGSTSPLLSLSPSEQGNFLIYDRRHRGLIMEFEKSQGTQRFIALPEGDLLVRKKRDGYYLEQPLLTQRGGIYHFNEQEGRKVQISSARRILFESPADEKSTGAVLREGEIVRLRLLETVSTKTSHAGDKIRLESAEDLYVNGRLVIPAGAMATGEILAMREKRGLVHGELVCRLGYVQAIDGQWVPLNSIISRSPAGLRRVQEGDNPLSPVGSDTETDIASGITAFFFLPFYPFLKGRNAVLQEGSLFDAYVARDILIR